MSENNWPAVSLHCRNLVKEFGPLLSTMLQSEPLAPLTDEYYGQLYSTQIHTKEPEKLQALLFQNYKIEIPVMRQDDKSYIRFSVQAFNSKADLDKLLEVMEDIKRNQNNF